MHLDSTNKKNKKKKRISVVEMNMWLAARSVASSSSSSDLWPVQKQKYVERWLLLL